MIYIPQESLKSIESFFAQSTQGIHLLFDHQTVARVLSIPTENIDFFSFENVNRVQTIFSELVDRKTFAEKMVYLSSLDSETYELILRTYFNIVENSIFESDGPRH